MSGASSDSPRGFLSQNIQRFGVFLAIVAYLYSVYYVHFGGEASTVVESGTKTLTVAHWQMEDGAREGWDMVFRRFEKMKAAQGEKVRVIQTVVPFRGYRQWFKTQLIGGKPVDLVRPLGPDALLNQYCVPLSSFLDDANPYNEGTPLEGMPWRDTFLDGMVTALNGTYAEYFTVNTSSATFRVYGNLDLIEKATGKRKMPENVEEWLWMLDKIQAYSKEVGRAMTGIGGGNLETNVFHHYFAEMNATLFAYDPFLSGRPAGYEAALFQAAEEGRASIQRMFKVADLFALFGPHVDESFGTMTPDQTAFLFYDSRLAFYTTGSWDANSLVQNAPFEVGISALPPLDGTPGFAEYFTGPVSESGTRTMAPFALTKASPNRQLALELLMYMTSYEMNQLAMYERKWLPAIKKAEYPGLLAYLKPRLEGNPNIQAPYFEQYGSSKPRHEMRKTIQRIMKGNFEGDASEYLYNQVRTNRLLYNAEMQERVASTQRSQMEKENQRCQLSLGILVNEMVPFEVDSTEEPGATPMKDRLRRRLALAEEGYSRLVKRLLMFQQFVALTEEEDFLLPPGEQSSNGR